MSCLPDIIVWLVSLDGTSFLDHWWVDKRRWFSLRRGGKKLGSTIGYILVDKFPDSRFTAVIKLMPVWPQAEPLGTKPRRWRVQKYKKRPVSQYSNFSPLLHTRSDELTIQRYASRGQSICNNPPLIVLYQAWSKASTSLKAGKKILSKRHRNAKMKRHTEYNTTCSVRVFGCN